VTGPRLEESNLVTACWPCNLHKGNRTFEQLGWRLRATKAAGHADLTQVYTPGAAEQHGDACIYAVSGWYSGHPEHEHLAVIAVTLLALLLLAAVPVALLAAVVMMILGHVVGGLAMFGGSVLAAALAVALAGMTGMQHLRKLVSRASFNIVQLDHGQYTDDIAEPNGSDFTDVVQLDRSEYTVVR
jgi:hypothetical protein